MECVDYIFFVFGLVYEVYVWLFQQQQFNVEDCLQFFGIVLNMMWCVFVDWVCFKGCFKCGGDVIYLNFEDFNCEFGFEQVDEIVVFDEVLICLCYVSECGV